MMALLARMVNSVRRSDLVLVASSVGRAYNEIEGNSSGVTKLTYELVLPVIYPFEVLGHLTALWVGDLIPERFAGQGRSEFRRELFG